MKTSKEINKNYIVAKEKVRQLQIFYMHLVGYIIVMALLGYNLYIMQGEYKQFFFWLDITVMVLWTFFIIIHAWNIFKGRVFFKKSWEERKLKEYMENNEKQKIII
jgi:hypothetical protein